MLLPEAAKRWWKREWDRRETSGKLVGSKVKRVADCLESATGETATVDSGCEHVRGGD